MGLPPKKKDGSPLTTLKKKGKLEKERREKKKDLGQLSNNFLIIPYILN